MSVCLFVRLSVCLSVCLSVSVGFRSWLPFNRRKGYELELDDDLSPFNLPNFDPFSEKKRVNNRAVRALAYMGNAH